VSITEAPPSIPHIIELIEKYEIKKFDARTSVENIAYQSVINDLEELKKKLTKGSK
jgi:hypothetical protein